MLTLHLVMLDIFSELGPFFLGCEARFVAFYGLDIKYEALPSSLSRDGFLMRAVIFFSSNVFT